MTERESKLRYLRVGMYAYLSTDERAHMMITSYDRGYKWHVSVNGYKIKQFNSLKAGKNWVNYLADTDFHMFNNPKNVLRLFGTETPLFKLPVVDNTSESSVEEPLDNDTETAL